MTIKMPDECEELNGNVIEFTDGGDNSDSLTTGLVVGVGVLALGCLGVIGAAMFRPRPVLEAPVPETPVTEWAENDPRWALMQDPNKSFRVG